MKRKDAEHVYDLIERINRAEICARLLPLSSQAAGDYFQLKLDLDDELRRFLYGTDDLMELGLQWGILESRKKKKKKKKKRKKKRKSQTQGYIDVMRNR